MVMYTEESFFLSREEIVMSNWYSMTASSLSVLTCRVAIFITGLHWMLIGDDLRLSIAAAALALTALPGNLIRDSLLRNATTTTIAILLAAHIVLGMQLEFYEKSALYDKAIHGLGSAAIAGVLMLFIRRYCGVRSIDLPAGLIAAFVLAGTVTAGTLWELFEFAIDLTGLFYAQRGLHDTMLDLLADTVGAVLAIAAFTTAANIKKSIIQQPVPTSKSTSINQ